MRALRLGDEGSEVLDVQRRLLALGHSIDPDELQGDFGASTEASVRSFQGSRHLRVDGSVGAETWGHLVEAGWRLGDRTLYIRQPMFRGDDVRVLQRKLNALGFDAGKEDGIFGPNTNRALREFQHNVGDDPDGIVGPHALLTLERMRPQGVSRAVVRERESIRGGVGTIVGQLIAIDPGYGPTDARGRGAATYLIATSLAHGLDAMGAKPLVLRAESEDPTPAERARAANEAGAAMCVSLQLGEEASGGPMCAHFGTLTSHSPAGLHLAELVLQELEAELAAGGHLQRLSTTMLRETRMPAIQVEPMHATEDRDPDRKDPETAGRVARAIAAGTRRWFGA